MEKILENPTFVIHIDELSPERKPFFMNMLNCAGYKDIHIFEGVNGHNSEQVNQVKSDFSINKIDNDLNNGQIGCMLSHFKLLKHIIDNQIQESNVFEDDIFFIKNWETLSKEYYNETPPDYDIIFIGNEMSNPNEVPKISDASCFCTHAYIIKLEGAKKMLHLLLNWDKEVTKINTGLYNIDNMIRDIQDRIKYNGLHYKFKWYCWNGTCYQGVFNNYTKLLNNGPFKRNCGLVFQNTRFKTTVK